MHNFKYLLVIVFLFVFQCNSTFSKIPNLDNRDKEKIKSDVLKTYLRSMNKWKIPFNDLLENKAGAACVQWEKASEKFLENGIFDALGYSRDIANKSAARIAAISGCEKMKEYYKLGETCSCEVIIVNDKNETLIPFEEPNIVKDFANAVEFYKKKNYNDALLEFIKLSELGDADSQYNLAYLYYKGLGTPQNFNKSLYWAWASQLSGEKKAGAIVKSSLYLLSDDEVLVVREDLRVFLDKRVFNGDTKAIIPLAKWYIFVSEEKNLGKSYLWYSVGTAFNIENSMRKRDLIMNELEQSEINQLQNEAQEIYQKIITLKK